MPGENLTEFQRRLIRQNVRAFLMTATRAELEQEKRISLEHGDQWRAVLVQELLDEMTDEGS